MAQTPATRCAGDWLDRHLPEGGGPVHRPDISRAESVIDIAPSGQKSMPENEPPKPPSSMTYQQYAVLPLDAQRKIWPQLPPWVQDEFTAAQRGAQPA